jgi:hypothetical protein
MKKIFLNVVLVLFGCLNAFSQGCLPEGITFTTQAQIDSFPINYPGCTVIDGDVVINGVWNISNLNGLAALTAIGGALNIHNSHLLTNFTGLDNLTSIGGYLYINTNINQASFHGLEALTSVGGYFWMEQYYNTTLLNFSGLDNLTSIGGYVHLANCALTSLTGLENLATIGGDLSISHITVNDLTGLDSLTSVGGDLNIGSNTSLASLSGLGSLTSIGGRLYIALNPAITSLSGIDNIDENSISNLFIQSNASLSTCEVRSVCEYLLSPNGSFDISNNAPGCSSVQEVEAACAWLSTDHFVANDEFFLYPCPSRNYITIETSLIPGQLTILNISAQQLIYRQVKEPRTIIDISALPPGMYIVELVTDQGKVREKLMVE